ncbi:MAG TPA: lactate utilization protein [Anaeromyxobacteraceae bacterium]|nr:lactate utilization protein [Anaeromyxobacteraceae bacterium]
MFETFRAKAQAVSAEVHRVAGRAEAVDFVVALLGREGVSQAPGAHALWAEGPVLAGEERGALAARAPGLRFDVTRELAASARVGVSEMDWMVANTGTLASAADGVAGRLVSMLPPLHVALVPSARIVPDLPALFGKLSPAETGYLALVTGPSRTADIERVLTIGVHGPARLVIVVWDPPAGRA